MPREQVGPTREWEDWKISHVLSLCADINYGQKKGKIDNMKCT